MAPCRIRIRLVMDLGEGIGTQNVPIWGVWVAALGVTVLLRPATAALRRPATATRPSTAGPRS
jgi:hypothetical protein